MNSLEIIANKQLDLLEKGGKRAVIGEKRMFGGREYIKTPDGWKFHGKGKGKKAQAHHAAHSQVKKDHDRLAKLKEEEKKGSLSAGEKKELAKLDKKKGANKKISEKYKEMSAEDHETKAALHRGTALRHEEKGEDDQAQWETEQMRAHEAEAKEKSFAEKMAAATATATGNDKKAEKKAPKGKHIGDMTTSEKLAEAKKLGVDTKNLRFSQLDKKLSEAKLKSEVSKFKEKMDGKSGGVSKTYSEIEKQGLSDYEEAVKSQTKNTPASPKDYYVNKLIDGYDPYIDTPIKTSADVEKYSQELRNHVVSAIELKSKYPSEDGSYSDQVFDTQIYNHIDQSQLSKEDKSSVKKATQKLVRSIFKDLAKEGKIEKRDFSYRGGPKSSWAIVGDKNAEKGDSLKKSNPIEVLANEHFDRIEKGGKRAVIGEIRTFAGRQHIKTASGWKYHGKGTGSKAQAHAAGTKKKVEVAKVKLTKAQKEVVDVMKQGIPITLQELEDKTGKKWGPLTTVLASLEKSGVIDIPDPYKNEYILKISSPQTSKKDSEVFTEKNSKETNESNQKAIDAWKKQRAEAKKKEDTPKKESKTITDKVLKEAVLKRFGKSADSIAKKHSHIAGYKPKFEIDGKHGLSVDFSTGNTQLSDSGMLWKQYTVFASKTPHKGKYSAGVYIDTNKNNHTNDSVSSRMPLDGEYDTYEEARKAALHYLGLNSDLLKKGDPIEILANKHFDRIEKGGKRAVLGEIRTFAGRQHIKTATGWKYHGKGTGAKAQAHKAASGGKKEDSEYKGKEIMLNGKKCVFHSIEGDQVLLQRKDGFPGMQVMKLDDFKAKVEGKKTDTTDSKKSADQLYREYIKEEKAAGNKITPKLREEARSYAKKNAAGTKKKEFEAAPSTFIRNHKQWNKDDYKYLAGKGWSDKKIKARWDEEAKAGKAPGEGKNFPNAMADALAAATGQKKDPKSAQSIYDGLKPNERSSLRVLAAGGMKSSSITEVTKNTPFDRDMARKLLAIAQSDNKNLKEKSEKKVAGLKRGQVVDYKGYKAEITSVKDGKVDLSYYKKRNNKGEPEGISTRVKGVDGKFVNPTKEPKMSTSATIQGHKLKDGDTFQVGDDSSTYTFRGTQDHPFRGFKQLVADNEFNDGTTSKFRIDNMKSEGLHIHNIKRS